MMPWPKKEVWGGMSHIIHCYNYASKARVVLITVAVDRWAWDAFEWLTYQ